MSTCPCCYSPLIRQIRDSEIHWFCRHCWQEMPDLTQSILGIRTRPAPMLVALRHLTAV